MWDSIGRVTSLGADAPGMSTAPMTASASLISCSIASNVETRVRTRPWNSSSSCRSRGIERSTIVTSAPRALAEVRLKAAGLPIPSTMIAADDIPIGKPAPDCFLVAADRLGVAADDCLVFEDAAAGIAAGEAAGADVVVITATHSRGVSTSHPTVVDYVGLSVTVGADGLIVTQD